VARFAVPVGPINKSAAQGMHMSVVSVTLKRGAAALLVMACAGAALAAPPASEREFIARAKAIKARTGALDSVNPVLTSFDLSGSVNTAASNQQVLATLNVTDDLSGVSSVWISLTAPSGRNVVQRYFEIVPTTATTLKVSLGPGSGPSDMGFGPWVEQGTWTVASVLLADLATLATTRQLTWPPWAGWSRPR
jgi:hypothetical protein